MFAQSEVGQNQEGAVAHGGWWADLGGVRAQQSSCSGGLCSGGLELVLLTSCQWHDFLHRGAAWRKTAHEFQCSMLCKDSLALGTWISVVQCHTGGPYFACYSSSLKCWVVILPDENAFLSLLCGEAEPIFWKHFVSSPSAWWVWFCSLVLRSTWSVLVPGSRKHTEE